VEFGGVFDPISRVTYKSLTYKSGHF
jgi:hypothetical protein